MFLRLLWYFTELTEIRDKKKLATKGTQAHNKFLLTD